MSETLNTRIARMNQRMADSASQALPDLMIGLNTGDSPLDSLAHDVRFRGKKIADLTREEAVEALVQAVARIKAMEWIR